MELEKVNYEDRISDIRKNVNEGKKYMFALTPKVDADLTGGVGGAAFETLNELFGSFITTGRYAGMTESEIFIDGVRYIHIDPARYGADDIKKPLSTELLENIVYHVDNAFKKGELPIGPDGKLQISMDDGTIYKITLAVQEDSSASHDAIVSDVDKFVRSLVGDYIDDETILNINTSGSFVHGGPAFDKGQSNTKCDVYGQSFSSLGGGPYGKDLTKVEPVLQVQAHLLAKELLEWYPDKDECLVLLDASIGRPETDIKVWFNGTKKSDKKAEKTAKTELAHLLNPHNVIETHLSDKKLYYEIAEHGFLGGVLGERYRPPFKI